VGTVTLPLPYLTISDRAHRFRNAAGLLVVALFLALLVHLMYPAVPPDFHDYGVVQTRFGAAQIFCGGESDSTCGSSTTVRFRECSLRALTDYLGPAPSRRLAALLGPAPSGKRWLSYSANCNRT
jgi:hypothetical protein